MGAKNEKLSAVESINKLEKRFNVIFIGDYAAGKTNFIWRSIHGQFDEVLPTVSNIWWTNSIVCFLSIFDFVQ